MYCRVDSEDEDLYDFHEAGSDVEDDVFEDGFVKLEWNMERDGDKVCTDQVVSVC